MHFCGRASQDPVAGFTGSLCGRERKEGKGREERREREGGRGTSCDIADGLSIQICNVKTGPLYTNC